MRERHRQAPFGDFVARAAAAGELVVQPRMGFGAPRDMRAGLEATRRARATTVGTITLDSYTRTGDHAAARLALATGADLNGYPIVTHPVRTTRALLDGMNTGAFPVQVRHGSARPQAIFTALTAAGLFATEGGPVSYCLPYSRLPLADSVRNWKRCCEILVRAAGDRAVPHLETFGGCMLGQLCPPSLLVALSVLEAVFFRRQGVRSVSLSYAQQTSPAQDEEAIAALRALAAEFLPDTQWHIVVYAYMGLYPRTRSGALALLEEAAELAVRTGSERLIVKTAAEAFRIPTIAQNVEALEYAASVAEGERGRAARSTAAVPDTGVMAEARGLVDAVLDLHPDVGRGLVCAFDRGYLDVPYCLHPGNAGRTSSGLDGDGRLVWTSTGTMPLGERRPGRPAPGGDDFLRSLSYVRQKFDAKEQIP
ncbi:methylaspartate mutase [Sphaerisporangium rubeum]|uniref:Methylaspartate mutase epsilon subunit n=1 Tax=Sphaerisporangium rubeum TaxID=321317 RepID=A0A7X0IL23_9ACTN|nr:methylaspartate mutase [Sphaerisporangium rubeum]MBB6476724.1 methylaspartate mutase epsilon subunit [Sphaerisporangium rubeum]